MSYDGDNIESLLTFAEDLRPSKEDVRKNIMRKFETRYYHILHPDTLYAQISDAMRSDDPTTLRQLYSRRDTTPIVSKERDLLTMILAQLPIKASDGKREWEVRRIEGEKSKKISPSEITAFIREVLTDLGYTLTFGAGAGAGVTISW